MPSLRVFLSYSHDSESHRERVLALADRLRADGLEAWIDQYDGHQENWPRWMQDQIDSADKVLVVCTETYRRRFEGHETDGGFGADWEGRLITGELYRRNTGKIVAIVFGRDDTDHLPKALRDGTWYEVGSEEGYEKLYRHLTGQAATPPPPVGRQKVMPPKRRRRSSLSPPPAKDSDAVDKYRAWASERHRHLELIGLGADDVQIELDQVFVPVRISHRRDELDALGGLGEGRHGRVDEDLALEEIFRDRKANDAPHALLFGEPGSGKTTALRKLHRLAREPASLGLDAETLPVFFRLRRWTPDLLDLSMGEVLDHELREVSGERLPAGLGEALWKRGRLLLLFDGLDEIGDEGYRAQVLGRMALDLASAAERGVRAVVSTRRSGWTEAVRRIELDGFRSLDLRPFDDAQIRSLVKLWFRAVSDAGFVTKDTAASRIDAILRTLTSRERRNQRLQVLVSTPMLLTLLCIVVTRGGEIPRRRVDFYEECLEILVGRWRQLVDREPPVSTERALTLAGELAWHLHTEKRRDDLRRMEAIQVFYRQLGEKSRCFEVFDWFVRDAGLLSLYTDRGYGFAHLGLQEHLTARHLASRPELLDEICKHFDDSWWVEVLQLVAALPKGQGFAQLVRRLLATDAPRRRADLLRTCLEEADAPDLRPFLEVLETSDDVALRSSLFLLLRGHRDPRIESNAELVLDAGASSPLASAAQAYLASIRSEDEAPDLDVLLVHGVEDEHPATRLAKALRGRALRVECFRASDSGRWGPRMDASQNLVIAVGSKSTDWREVVDSLFDDSLDSWLVRLPGEPRPAVPEGLSGLRRVDLARFENVDVVDRLAYELRKTDTEVALAGTSTSSSSAIASATVVRGRPTRLYLGDEYHEPVTGEIFLAVPGGRFQMGADDISERERPIHWVEVSPFWLARTPVTNRQYSLFLEAHPGRDEPKYWRDRQFSDPSQPVVGVSWHDAADYCAWLSEISEHEGTFRLPREAEWEFAARGEDGREYPWGDERPDDSLACFALGTEKDKPASVGSYLAGAGPFGHLDLAGNVWEWCENFWEPNYARWAVEEASDPIGQADESLRPLRGGCWLDSAERLRSAFRSRSRLGNHLVSVGFRVLCAPASE